jgi:hypothetical protein
MIYVIVMTVLGSALFPWGAQPGGLFPAEEEARDIRFENS